MGKLVGLLSSGIGLVMEASASYQRPPSKGISETRQVSTPPSRGSPAWSRDSFQDDEEERQSHKAFYDVQDYANYQQNLAAKGERELEMDFSRFVTSPGSIPPSVAPERDFQYGLEGQQESHCGYLPYPVIIPQRRPETKDRGLMRAYAPSLMNCRIDQETFLNFLDAFNEAHKSSPCLDVVNVATMGVGFAPGIRPMVVSMVVPLVVRSAKSVKTNKQSDSYLDRMNAELFVPHGLYAMIITYKPNEQSQACTVDTSSPLFSRSTKAQEDNSTDIQLPPSAPLIFPEPDIQFAKTGFSKMGHFIADYGDHRAQARYVHNNPNSPLAIGPQPTFKSRWGDPDHPGNNGNLRSLLSGTAGDQKVRRRDRRDSIDSNKRDRRRDKKNAKKGGKTSLIGSVRGMVSGPGNEDLSLIKGMRRKMGGVSGRGGRSPIQGIGGAGMNKDILYLMVVNNSGDDRILSRRHSTFDEPPRYQRQQPQYGEYVQG